MMGKEGAVDSIIKKDADRVYFLGVRAYEMSNGNMIIKLSDGREVPCFIPYTIQQWHALRAYQDEQRKKGEPIENVYEVMQMDWYNRRLYRDGVVYYFCGEDGSSKGMIKPAIVLFIGSEEDSARAGVKYGGFTNFRWRPGHEPKEKAKVRIGPDYLSVVYPPFEIPN